MRERKGSRRIRDLGYRKMPTVVKIKINTIDAVKTFCNITAKQDFDIDIVSSRYTVDAKSIMGIFSLDITKEVELHIHETKENCKEFLNAISEYIVAT